jgi:hypothetical protein
MGDQRRVLEGQDTVSALKVLIQAMLKLLVGKNVGLAASCKQDDKSARRVLAFGMPKAELACNSSELE